MKNQIFGLDISDRSIEALQLRRQGKQPVITAYARVTVRSPFVSNGVIKKPDQLASAIKTLLASAKPSPITTPYCVVSLPEAQVFTTVFSLPAGLKRNEIFKTIPIKAEEVIPFKTDEIYFDFRTIRADASTQEVFYIAVPKKIVDAYVSVLNAAGLIPVAFDVESVSVARSVAGALVQAEPVLIADIGARTTNLNVFDQNGIRDSRTIKIAGSSFTRAIAKTGVSAKDAESQKVKNGFDQSKQSAQALSALQKEGGKLAGEMQKFLTYYYREHHRRVSGVILVGGSALLPKIDQFLGAAVKLPVQVGEPFANIGDPSNILKGKAKSVIFANALGLALRGLSQNPQVSDINLLPVTATKAKATHWIAPAVMIVVALAAVASAMYVRFYGFNFPMAGSNIPTQTAPTPVPVAPQPPTPVATTTATTTTAVGSATTTPTTTPSLGSIQVRPTTIGYINVRQQPTTASAIVGRGNTGQQFLILAEQSGWVQIIYSTTTNGWVSGVYVDKLR